MQKRGLGKVFLYCIEKDCWHKWVEKKIGVAYDFILDLTNQPAITCLKLTIETQGVKYVQS